MKRIDVFLTRWMACAALLLWVISCRAEVSPTQQENRDVSDPVHALYHLVDCLRDNDVLRYSKASVTESQFDALKAQWRAGNSIWPISSVPLGEDIPRMIISLSSPGEKVRLRGTFDRQLANQSSEIHQAVASLREFALHFLQKQSPYSPANRSYYKQLVQAFSEWALQAPLADRKHAYDAIANLTVAARRTGFTSINAMHTLDFEDALRRLGPFLAAVKYTLNTYGMSLDDALQSFRAELVDQTRTRARIHYQYMLADHPIEDTVEMVLLNGQWCLQQTQDTISPLITKRIMHTEHPPLRSSHDADR